MKLVKYIAVQSNAHKNVGKTECTATYPLPNCNMMMIAFLGYDSLFKILVR